MGASWGAGADGPAGVTGAGLGGRGERWGAAGGVGAAAGVAGAGVADGWGACSDVVVTAGAGSAGAGLAACLFRHDDSKTTSTAASVKTLGKLRRPWPGANVKSHQSRKTRYHGSLPFRENAAGTWSPCLAR